MKAVQTNEDVKHCMMIHPPRPLSAGKTSWNVFTSYTEFWGVLKHLGHRGPALTHVAAVRLAFSATYRTVLQQLAAYRQGCDGIEHDFICLLGLVICTACPLHDAQNALKWAVAEFAGGNVLRDTHTHHHTVMQELNGIIGGPWWCVYRLAC